MSFVKSNSRKGSINQTKMYKRSSTKSINNRHSLLLLLLVLSFCWQCSLAVGIRELMTNNVFASNPNIRCPGKNEVTNIWRPCKYGGYIENYDPHNCADRYVCYVGLDEMCYPGDRCADNAICTVCGICQKCESREKCSDFRLCPGIRGMDLFKRYMQKRMMDLNEK